MENNNTKPPYNGWLISNSFLKRSFALYGYFLVAHLIVLLPIILIGLIGSIFLTSMLNAKNKALETQNMADQVTQKTQEVASTTSSALFVDPQQTPWTDFKLVNNYDQQNIPTNEFYKQGEDGNNWTEMVVSRYWKGYDFTTKNYKTKLAEVIKLDNNFKKNLNAVDIAHYNIGTSYVETYYATDWENKKHLVFLGKIFPVGNKLYSVMYLNSIKFSNENIDPQSKTFAKDFEPDQKNIQTVSDVLNNQGYINEFLNTNYDLPK